MISVGIVGGTGYTGAELLRLLAAHPQVEIRVVTSRSRAGQAVTALYPGLSSIELEFSQPETTILKQCDCVFFAASNGTAMHMAPELLDAGVKVIDLSADFRIEDAAVWERWYGQPHACPEVLGHAVYGLSELHREKIQVAQLVANPGCYPTAVILGFLPLLEQGLADNTAYLIADAKSGVSGAGRGANVPALFSEAGENFKAYNVAAHRHWPEVKQELEGVTGGEINLTFTPHLTPMVRGIFATLYISGVDESVDLNSVYQQRYAGEHFIQVMNEGALPETKHVRGSNYCLLSVQRSHDGNMTVVLSVIDNLVKGAAGQAVQNMNLMYGLEESTGLTQSGLFP